MCLAHYTQPHPCFGQLPKNCDTPWGREGLTQGENRVTGRVIMLGGYFVTAERGWGHICLFFDTSFKENQCHVHDQQWSPASAFFLLFYVMHLNPPTPSFSLTRLQQISTVRGATSNEKVNAPLPSVMHCNCEACQVKVKQKPWAVVTDSLRGTVVSAQQKKKNEMYYFEPASRIHREWVTCHTSKIGVKNL